MALSARRRNGFYADLASWDMALLEYLPLAKPNELRLLSIQPGSFDAPLTLNIFHSTLQQAGSIAFDALSYVWGSPDNPRTVNVNIASTDGGIRAFAVSVTYNLATALQHLRYTNVTRIVWADAICINQRDYDERAQQVLMMGDIYRWARSVVAFLGPTMNDSTIAMNLIRQISQFVDVDFGCGRVKPSTAGAAEPGWADMHKPLDVEPDRLRSLYHLVHREWFERLWIRQEIGLGGSRATLLCGHDSIEWSSFCRAIFVLHRRPLANPDILDKHELESLRERIGIADTVALYSKRAFRFTNLRRQIGKSKCSDHRDRIYGVLGQLRDAAQIGIVPDYTKSVSEVYVDATQKSIRLSGDLSVLCQCELRDTAQQTHDLPTWVPDWSSPLFSASVHEAKPAFFDQLPAYESMDKTTLRAYGMQCGRIARVAKPFGSTLEGTDDLTTARVVRDVLFSLNTYVTETNMDPGSNHFIEVFCRCLWLNNFATRWLPPVPYETPFAESLELVRTLLDASSNASHAITLPEASRCLTRLREACRDRAMFVTEDGHLGMGPESVKVGDEVCLLFGTWKPVVLRPNPQQDYQVVGGDCYVHGMMSAEPILGPLPSNVRGLLDPNAVGGLRSAGYMDIYSDRILETDTRIVPFLCDLVQKGVLSGPTLYELGRQGVKETLVTAGIPIQIFDLV